MQFSPKNTTRYSSALRIYLHKKILKGSTVKSVLPKLKKIMLFEAVKSQSETVLDIMEFSDTLLSAATLKLIRQGLALKLEFYGEGFVKCDIKKIQALLLKAVEYTVKTDTPWINATLKGDAFIVAFFGILKENDKEFFKKINAIFFRVHPSNKNYLIYKVKRTKHKSTASVSIWEYLLNPFSALNVMLYSLD